MKYLLLLMVLLIPLYSYAGCEEMQSALLNIEKSIEQQSTVLAEIANDRSFSAEIKRAKVKKEMGELIELRKNLSEQQCNQGGREIPVAAAKPAAPVPNTQAPTPPASKFIGGDNKAKDKDKSKGGFKPAGKMY